MVGDQRSRQKCSQAVTTDEAVSSLIDKAIDSVAVTIATKIHRNLKEKQIRTQSSSSEALDRQKLYPELYESEKDVAKALEEYGVETPPPLKRQRSGNTSGSKYAQIQYDTEDASNTNNTTGMVTRQQSQTDIWGRFPAKEPKELVECSICGRQVNGLRFAPHLDKCMGIGTTSRAASSIGGSSLGTRSSQF